jgi:hypothetical protein
MAMQVLLREMLLAALGDNIDCIYQTVVHADRIEANCQNVLNPFEVQFGRYSRSYTDFKEIGGQQGVCPLRLDCQNKVA